MKLLLQKKILKSSYNLFCFFFFWAFLCQNPAFCQTKVLGVESTQNNVLDASKNAKSHSNMGNIYFEEKNYVAAIKEYEIAFNLAPNTRLASTYLYNISRCYMVIQRYDLAYKALLGAISKDYMNITYYNALADCAIALGNIQNEIKKLNTDTKNPYNKITVGMIYLKTGKIREAKTIFDDFIAKNPDNIMSDDIKTILKNL